MDYPQDGNGRYVIPIDLSGKYAYSDEKFNEKYKNKFLKTPIHFELNREKGSSGDLHPLLALGYGVLIVPVALVGLVVVGIASGPSSYK